MPRIKGEIVWTCHTVSILSFFRSNRIQILLKIEMSPLKIHFCIPFFEARCVPIGWVLANRI